jgi:hypothetical protein
MSRVDYEPGESQSPMYGGNSNWRGSIWMPTNFLLCETLQRFHHYYGDSLKVKVDFHPKKMLNLLEVSQIISRRLIELFTVNDKGKRAIYHETSIMNSPGFVDYPLFYEYFDAETGRGLGASVSVKIRNDLASNRMDRINSKANSSNLANMKTIMNGILWNTYLNTFMILYIKS